jgi:acetyl-CoA C-acetyltransferase
MSVPSTTINKVCLSGLNAIHLADQMISSGEAEVVIAGGMESMTNAPYLLPNARGGYRYGNSDIVDAIQHDGLYCALEHELMGEGTERYAASANIDRQTQDAIAAASHDRAARATKDGLLADEIVPVSVPQRRGDPIVVTTDEGIRGGTDEASLAKLRPAFAEAGNITAGNASQISDGASATVICSAETAQRLGLSVLAELVSYGQVAGPDTSLLTQPSRAIKAALNATDLSVDDIDLFEINEAFAAVGAASTSDLGIDDSIVNVNGGAIALGHPIGCSGNRLALTLAYELARRGGGLGAAALCGGGGQGDALVMRVPTSS